MMFPSHPGWSYRVDHGPGYFLPHVGLLLFPACFGFGAADSQGSQRVVLLVIAAVMTAPLGLALWLTLPTWNDKLTIHPDGFEYRRRGRAWAFRWDDIADMTYAEKPGRRLMASSVSLRAGGEFRFAYRMSGLDLLGQEYADQLPLEEDAEEPDDEDASGQDLGPHEGTYRVRNGCSGFLPVAFVGSLAVLMLLYVISEPGVASLACFAPFGVSTTVLVWGIVGYRHDELTIYRNGFTYRDRKGTQQCLWDEIEDYQTTSSGTLVGLKKVDGPWIHLAGSMSGIDKLQPHVRRVIPSVERPDGDSSTV